MSIITLPTARKRTNQDGYQILSLKVFQSPGEGVPFASLKYAGPEKAKPDLLWLVESQGGYGFAAGGSGVPLTGDTEQSLKTAIRYLFVGVSRRMTPLDTPLVGSGRKRRFLCPYCLRLEPARSARLQLGDVVSGQMCGGPLGPLPLPALHLTLKDWLIESHSQGGACSLLAPGRPLQQYHVPPEYHPLSLGEGGVQWSISKPA